MTSTGSDQRAYQMTMNKGDPSYDEPPARAVRRARHGGSHLAAPRRHSYTERGEIQWHRGISSTRAEIYSSVLYAMLTPQLEIIRTVNRLIEKIRTVGDYMAVS